MFNRFQKLIGLYFLKQNSPWPNSLPKHFYFCVIDLLELLGNLIPFSVLRFRLLDLILSTCCFRIQKNDSTGVSSGTYTSMNIYLTSRDSSRAIIVRTWRIETLFIIISVSSANNPSVDPISFISLFKNLINVSDVLVFYSIAEYDKPVADIAEITFRDPVERIFFAVAGTTLIPQV